MNDVIKVFPHSHGELVIDEIRFTLSVNVDIADAETQGDVFRKIAGVIDLELKLIDYLRQQGHKAHWHDSVIYTTPEVRDVTEPAFGSSPTEPPAKAVGFFQPNSAAAPTTVRAEYVKVVTVGQKETPAIAFVDDKGDNINGVKLMMQDNKINAARYKTLWNIQGGNLPMNDASIRGKPIRMAKPVVVSYKENDKGYIDVTDIKEAS